MSKPRELVVTISGYGTLIWSDELIKEIGGVDNILNPIRFREVLPEVPKVDEDLEAAADDFAWMDSDKNDVHSFIVEAFKAGAEWQKDKDAERIKYLETFLRYWKASYLKAIEETELLQLQVTHEKLAWEHLYHEKEILEDQLAKVRESTIKEVVNFLYGLGCDTKHIKTEELEGVCDAGCWGHMIETEFLPNVEGEKE